MDVVKESGRREDFSRDKLCLSIQQAGAPKDVALRVCNNVELDLKPNVTTRGIWRVVSGYLVHENLEYLARYSLRHGVSRLGPTGFLFEQFVEALLQIQGYETSRDIHMKGGSGIEHEIDVLAKKKSTHIIVEAKYRNDRGIKTHVDVVMYAYARLLDIEEHQRAIGDTEAQHEVWVITNTKFTRNCIMYANHHKSLRLIGWGYPKEGNLEDMIVHGKLYPITVLPGLTSVEQKRFTEQNVILVRDLLPYTPEMLEHEFGIISLKAIEIHKQVHELLGTGGY